MCLGIEIIVHSSLAKVLYACAKAICQYLMFNFSRFICATDTGNISFSPFCCVLSIGIVYFAEQSYKKF